MPSGRESRSRGSTGITSNARTGARDLPPQPVWNSVMRAERPLRRVRPPVVAPARALVQVARIIQLVADDIPLTDHHQARVRGAVVDEVVRDPGSGREGDGLALFHAVQPAVDPGIALAFQDEDELLFLALGMRVAGAMPGQQALVMDADAGQAEVGAEVDIHLHLLGVVVVGAFRLALVVADPDDAVGAMLRKGRAGGALAGLADRKSTRLNSSHSQISYAVFC